MKKFLIALLLLIAIPVSGMTLYEYYNGKLPTIEERAPKYNEHFSDKYTGSAVQNTNWVNVLLDNEVDNQVDNGGLVLGATLPQGVAVFQTSLLSQISSSDTSMTLRANSVRGGGTLSGFHCFTVDEGSSIAEYICGTVSGTSVTSLIRGVDPLTGTTTNATLQFPHRRGAEVKITDFPLLQIMRNQLNGTESIPNVLFYSSNVTISSSTQLATKKYVDDTSVAGAPDANTTTKGVIEIATSIENASSTATGGTSATLVPSSSTATSSPRRGCNGTATAGALCIVVAQNDGKISPNFIATSSSDVYNYGGIVSFNASTSLTATTTIAGSNALSRALIINNVPYAFPGSQGSADTSLVNNGSGTLSWTRLPKPYTYASTSSATIGANISFTSSSLTIPAGTLTASSSISVEGTLTCVSGGFSANVCSIALEDTDGVTYASFTTTKSATSRNTPMNFSIRVVSDNSTSAQKGIIDGIEFQTGGSLDVASFSSATTNTANWSNAKTFRLRFVTTSGSSNTGTLNPFTIIVTP